MTQGSKRGLYASYAGLWAAAIAVGVVHYVLADGGRGPGIFADEVGYLANARYLAGGGLINMSNTAFYSAGWSIAIVPVSRLFAHHPGRLYSAVISTQALLAVGSVVLMGRLCRWLFDTSWSVAILAATVAGLYPAFVTNTGFAWSESMLAFGLLVVFTASIWLVRAGVGEPPPSRVLLTRGLVVGVACAYLVTVHRRTLFAMLGLVVGLGAYLLWQRRPRAAATLFVSFVVFAYAGEKLNRHLDSAMWGGKGGVDTSGKLSTLLTAHGLKETLVTGAGQTWYQLVGTGGLVAIGLFALVFVGLDQKSRSTERRVTAAMIIGVFALLLAVSIVFLENGQRADQVFYGRYVDMATPLLVAVAITWISTRPSRRLLGVVAASLGAWLLVSWFVLHQWGGTRLAEPYNRVTTIAIVAWLHGGSPELGKATLVALLVGLGTLAIAYVVHGSSRAGTAGIAMAVTVACLFAWQLGFVHDRILTGLDAGSDRTQAVASRVRSAHVSEVALEPSMTVPDRLALEFWLPGYKFVRPTPDVVSCSKVMAISRESRATTTAVTPVFVGGLYLFHGQSSCPSLR